MLVLSRHRDETIMLGDDIELTVVDIRRDKVRIGITAPAHIPVHRKEVYDAIMEENRQAMGLQDPSKELPPGIQGTSLPYTTRVEPRDDDEQSSSAQRESA